MGCRAPRSRFWRRRLGARRQPASEETPAGASWLVVGPRFCVGIAALFFAAQHFLHPKFAPGVPLAKLSPFWIPFAPLWAYLTGLILLVTGVALIMNKAARITAAGMGILMTLLALFVYLPMLTAAARPPEMSEGINYVADTLLFAGTSLLLARALPTVP